MSTPPTNANRGNPNVWTTYTGGVMELTLTSGVTSESTNVIKTTMNQVQFCGDLTIPASVDYPYNAATLPEGCRPNEEQVLLCATQLSDGGYDECALVIGTDGTITVSLDESRTGGTTYPSPTTYTLTAGAGVSLSDDMAIAGTDGNVSILGNATITTTSDYPMTLATLPVGARPVSDMFTNVICLLEDGTYTPSLLGITTDGAIQLSLETSISFDYPVPKVVYMSNIRFNTGVIASGGTGTKEKPSKIFLNSVSFDLASGIYGSYNPS